MIIISWYTNFYCAYQTKEGKIYPYGPFDYSGDYKCIHWTSRSFTTDLKEWFEPVTREQVSEELLNAIYDTELDNESFIEQYWGVCPIDALPKSDFIKTGYFLIDDIQNYQKDNDTEDLFYDWLDSDTYARKLENELKFGKPTEIIDKWGEKCTPKSCADYSYFCYPDYHCKEYEVFKLKNIIYSMYEDYKENIPKGAKIVIFKTEG